VPLTYPWKDCPWVVHHKAAGDTHLAWRMRAFLLGDFQRKRPAKNDFVINRDGTPGDSRTRPLCETCGVVPKTDDLVVIERSTGARHFLDRAAEMRLDGKMSEDRLCRWCQDPRVEVSRETDRLCPACYAEHTRGPAVDAADPVVFPTT
jgi:hypothetical protein